MGKPSRRYQNGNNYNSEPLPERGPGRLYSTEQPLMWLKWLNFMHFCTREQKFVVVEVNEWKNLRSFNSGEKWSFIIHEWWMKNFPDDWQTLVPNIQLRVNSDCMCVYERTIRAKQLCTICNAYPSTETQVLHKFSWKKVHTYQKIMWNVCGVDIM